MPIVLRLGNWKFFFYSNEGDPREPIHIHVRDGKSEAKIWLQPEIVLAYSKGFSGRDLRIMLEATKTHVALIEKAWHEHFGN